MIDGQRVLAVIPARGGSKGVPRKNLRPLAGRPLIAWSLDAARASRYLDRTVLSSEDEEIIAVFRDLGGEVAFRRPDALAQDDTPGIAPLLHACEQLPGYDWVVLLQPTSPLRSGADIDACLEACLRSTARTALSVVEERHGLHLLYTRQADQRLVPALPALAEVTRRQDAPRTCRLNGAVYVAHVPTLLKNRTLLDADTLGVLMPESRSLDIDTLEDFELAEWRLQRLAASPRP